VARQIIGEEWEDAAGALLFAGFILEGAVFPSSNMKRTFGQSTASLVSRGFSAAMMGALTLAPLCSARVFTASGKAVPSVYVRAEAGKHAFQWFEWATMR
jgi:hypothetical protein